MRTGLLFLAYLLALSTPASAIQESRSACGRALDVVGSGKKFMELHARAIQSTAANISQSFKDAHDWIVSAKKENRHIYFVGVGKSHLVGSKIAESFKSAHISSTSMSGTDALHGSLGSIKENDVVFLISNSGTTDELLLIAKALRTHQPDVGIIAVTSNANSPLAELADLHLNICYPQEACPHGLLPTSSTSATQALLDSLLATVNETTGFTPQDFGRSHPAGRLGAQLLVSVSERMRGLDDIAYGPSTTSLAEVKRKMEEYKTGAFVVVDKHKKVIGIFTDGDARRLDSNPDFLHQPIENFMTKTPFTLPADTSLFQAGEEMSGDQRTVNAAPVVDERGTLLGLVSLHELRR